jgi:hypothetical protein
MVYIQYKEEKEKIFLSNKLIKQYNIVPLRLIVKIGAWAKELMVTVDDELPEDTIGLPKEVTNKFTIPEDLSYEIVLDHRTLSLGPVIAFVAYFTKQQVTPKRLDRLKGRFKKYEDINGLIYVCAAKGINVSEKTIEGYYFNPNGTSITSRWIQGVFPYPDTVYKRHPIDPGRYNDLVSQIGDKVINSYYFCKGELPEYVSNNTELQKYFPDTKTLEGIEQLEEMITLYESVYLKPRNGAQGRGILHVSLDEFGRYVFVNRKKEVTVYNGGEKLKEYLNTYIKRRYIIQQSVSTKQNQQNLDFRVYAQKNGLKKWQCQGIIGRVAKKDTIITNLKYVDQLLSGIDAIKYLFDVNDNEANLIQQKIFDACLSVCSELDKNIGNYGDVAIDCIVDEQCHVWILEINKLYGVETLRKMKKKELMTTLFTTPFQYAKALAGF